MFGCSGCWMLGFLDLGCLVFWMSDAWFSGSWMLGFSGCWMFGFSGSEMLGFPGYWMFGCSGCWMLGFSGCWMLGISGCWMLGISGCWMFGCSGCWMFGFSDIEPGSVCFFRILVVFGIGSFRLLIQRWKNVTGEGNLFDKGGVWPDESGVCATNGSAG